MALVLALAVLLALPASAVAQPGLYQRPNLLVIVTDDQPARGTMQVMPRTRRLIGRQGTTYANAHVTTPRCCPARASFFTGLYAHNHGVVSNRLADRLDHSLTIQRVLYERGYRTGLFGKFLNRWPAHAAPPHFEEWAVAPNNFRGARWNRDGRVEQLDAYSTDLIAGRTLEFIRDSEAEDWRPWLAWVMPYAPHLPATPAERHAEAPLPPPRSSPALREQDASDKPEFLAASRGWVRPAERMRDPARRSLLAVDEMVGRLSRALEALGEQNTLVVFTSDNGFMVGEHGGLVGKGLPYHASTAVPLMMRWPGWIRKGRVRRDLVTNLDVTATLFEAAGVDHPTDGRSLFGPPRPDRMIFMESHGEWNTGFADDPGMLPPWRSVRGRDFRYTEYLDAGMAEATFREFYDLRRDPWELENRAQHLAPAQVEALSAQLAEMAACSGHACP